LGVSGSEHEIARVKAADRNVLNDDVVVSPSSPDQTIHLLAHELVS
jgi:hypothetical protein